MPSFRRPPGRPNRRLSAPVAPCGRSRPVARGWHVPCAPHLWSIACSSAFHSWPGVGGDRARPYGRRSTMKIEQVHELLYQALETEQGGIQVYETAVSCAKNADLKKEWQEYLEQTHNHERVLLDVFQELGVDPKLERPGRTVVRHLGMSLVKAMQMAKGAVGNGAAQLVAA